MQPCLQQTNPPAPTSDPGPLVPIPSSPPPPALPGIHHLHQLYAASEMEVVMVGPAPHTDPAGPGPMEEEEEWVELPGEHPSLPLGEPLAYQACHGTHI